MYYLDKERMKIIEELRNKGVSEKVVELISTVKREKFLPNGLTHLAYKDLSIDIGEGQRMTKISTIVYILEKAEIFNEMKVLEIGTGSGYLTALLSLIAKEVYTVEVSVDFYYRARSILIKNSYKNVFFRLGNGMEGWDNYAPFDRIFINAAVPALPEKIIEQLNVGGVVIYPRDYGEQQKFIKGIKRKGYNEIVLKDCYFVKVRGVAQIGSASGSGPEGRRFNSSRPDDIKGAVCYERNNIFRE